jgi:hypothetical protein
MPGRAQTSRLRRRRSASEKNWRDARGGQITKLSRNTSTNPNTDSTVSITDQVLIV